MLIKDERFKNLSTDAKLLYGLMLDRMNLSVKNGWCDKDGRVYIIFTIEEIKDSIGCAEKKAVKLLDELEKKYGLIERKRQGLGKPNLIYVKNFISGAIREQFMNCQNDNSKVVKMTIHDQSKAQCNNTDINNTEYSYTESVLSSQTMTDGQMDIETIIKENIDYNGLMMVHEEDKALIDEFLNIILDTMLSKGTYIHIGKEDKPRELVKSAMMKLRYAHIEQVLWNFKTCDQPIKRKKQYILTMLYNISMELKTGMANEIHSTWGY